VEGTIKTDPIPVIFFMVVTDFNRILNCLGSGVGKEGRIKAELGGYFH